MPPTRPPDFLADVSFIRPERVAGVIRQCKVIVLTSATGMIQRAKLGWFGLALSPTMESKWWMAQPFRTIAERTSIS